MNKAKLIGSLLLAALGAVVAFYPFSPTIPKQSELASASGILLSSKFRPKIGSEFQIEGTNQSFVYQSHGRLCGNVHDQLLAEVGKPISVRYLPTQTKDWSGNPRLLRAFDISGHQSPICSYWQVSEMIQSDFKAVPLLGHLMLLLGLVSAFTSLSRGDIEKTSNTKTWKDLRNDIAAEEGERIIGEQWKTRAPHE
jgi:hypothetical protein